MNDWLECISLFKKKNKLQLPEKNSTVVACLLVSVEMHCLENRFYGFKPKGRWMNQITSCYFVEIRGKLQILLASVISIWVHYKM